MKNWQKNEITFLSALAAAIKDLTASIRKHTNELKVHKKTVKKAIKRELSTDLTPSLDYVINDVLENKTNATFHPNICTLKTAIEEKWNKMSEESI